MDTKPLASFAVNSRLRLLQSSKNMIAQSLLPNSQNRLEKPSVVAELERQIASSSLDEVAAEVSYLWFNRLLALTMLDAIGFNSPAAVTPSEGLIFPEILQEAKSGRLDPKTNSFESRERINGLLAGQIPSTNMDAEIYGILLQGVTRSWGVRFPMIFQASSEIAEMLAPSDLLSLDSIRSDFLTVIQGPYAKDVETIGWLFQFYNSDVKDSAFAKFKAGKKATHEDLVAATQIFTPRAVADSMVENTLGSLWARMHPDSELAKSLPEIARLDSECPEVLTPEELTIMDPAVGSGNLLLSSFDYLEKIYLESGHNDQSIPGLILEYNLHGLEIDPRAASLAAFAIFLRASRGLSRVAALELPQPRITFLEDYPAILEIAENCKDVEVKKRLIALANAGTLGALVQLRISDIEFLDESRESQGILADSVDRAVKASQSLIRKYAVVIANPPYMGPKNMPARLKGLIEENFSEGKADLYAAFIMRCQSLLRSHGRVSLITQLSWIKIQRFASLRQWIISQTFDQAFINLGTGVFAGVGTVVRSVIYSAGNSGGLVAKYLNTKESQPLHVTKLSNFSILKSTPFLLELPEDLIGKFESALLVRDVSLFNSGIATGENSVFVKFWWEVEPKKIAWGQKNDLAASGCGKRWFPYQKGGSPTKWYGNAQHVVDWESDGMRLRSGLKADGSHRNFQLMSREFMFQPFITYSGIAETAAFRFVGEGFLADRASSAIQTANPFALMAFLNSSSVCEIVNVSNPSLNVKENDWSSVPILVNLEELGPLGSEAWKLSKVLWDSQETSMDFDFPSWLTTLEGGLESSMSRELRTFHDATVGISKIQDEIDTLVSPAYCYPWRALAQAEERDNPIADRSNLQPSDFQARALSRLAGMMLGRFEGGSVPNPHLDADNVLPIMRDNYFDDDFSSRLTAMLPTLTGRDSTPDLNWLISELGKPIRDWMRMDFYSQHLKTYMGAPIYWMISSPKGTFKALTYIHRLSLETFSTCRSKYVQPLMEKLRAQHNSIVRTEPKKAEALASQIADLRELDDRLYHLIINPPVIDLDEGVVKNHARFASVLQKIK